MKITPEKRNSQYRSCYELLFENPRIYLKDISSILGINRRTVTLRMKEAFQEQYIVGPEIRKRSFLNLREYVYFIKCETPEVLFLELRENPDVIYHCQMSGFCNLLVIAKKKIDVEAIIILEGFRSDYLVSFALLCSWRNAIKTCNGKIEHFDPDMYVPKDLIKTHFDEKVEWDLEDEALYRYFKYDLRRPVSLAMKENEVSGGKLYDFLEKLPEYCTIATSYFPETITAYDQYLFMFETDYEDFLIDLFSQFPTTSWFFKVADRLFLHAYVPTEFVKNIDLHANIDKWYIPSLMIGLSEKEIIKSKAHAIFEYHWSKNL
jgi:hypothetical protein